MDHQWRSRPMQGNICPTCSISHFPFCLPHPSIDQYPRFSLENNRSFHRPVMDQFIDNRAHPFVSNPNGGYGDPRYWDKNPNLERDVYGQSSFQSQIGGLHRDGFGSTIYDYGKNDFLSEGDRNNKRMRFDETASGSFSNDYHLNPVRFMSEDERRLKLIHDHGGACSGVPHGGAVSGLGIIGFNGENKEYAQENSISERNFGNGEVMDRGKFDDFRGCRDEIRTNNFHGAAFCSTEREGSSFREEHGSTFGQQHMPIDRNGFQSNVDHSVFRNESDGVYSQNEGLKQSQYFRNDHPPHAPLPSHGQNGLPARVSNNVGQSHLSLHVPYPNSEVQNENYYGQNLQHLQLKNSMSGKEPQYSHVPNWQVPSGLSVPYHETSNNIPAQPYTVEHPLQLKQDFQSHGQLNDVKQPVEPRFLSQDSNQGIALHQNSPLGAQYGSHKQGGYLPIQTGGIKVSESLSQMQASRFHAQPPLPASPPPPLPLGPPDHTSSKSNTSSSAPMSASPLFPVSASSLATTPSLYLPVPGANSLSQPYFHNKSHLHASTGFDTEEPKDIRGTSSKQYLADGQPYLTKHLSSEKPNYIDASLLFKQPHRVARPDHIVIILRGLPGSGKSYLAKMLRDLEVESGGDAPRIYSMDDYFMTEVEKVEESESQRYSARGKKPIVKKVMEYFYEPEMEEAYRASMLKAFKKTLEEGAFTFIIVDDRNLRVADFAQFWAIAKRSGYEVYLLEASYKDPVGCAARNVHGFTQDDIQRMAGQWEEAPCLYLQLDIKSLFHGDDLKESGIQEVDMDTGDGDFDGGLSGSQEEKYEKVTTPPVEDYPPDGSSNDGKRWDAEGDHPAEEVKELGSSKWSNDLDEDDTETSGGPKEKLNALSGLIQAYSKGGKSVHWGDQAGNSGFSIGAAKKGNSLVIGPGSGYNLKSNPLPEEENLKSGRSAGESKRQSVFQEQLRAERESFRAVFDRRRHRIGGLDADEE